MYALKFNVYNIYRQSVSLYYSISLSHIGINGNVNMLNLKYYQIIELFKECHEVFI